MSPRLVLTYVGIAAVIAALASVAPAVLADAFGPARRDEDTAMSAVRLAAIAVGGAGMLLFLVCGARGKCQSWLEAFLCVVGTVAVICGVVGVCWLLMYGITGEWPS